VSDEVITDFTTYAVGFPVSRVTVFSKVTSTAYCTD
jgi:hypothetical protein